MPPKEIEAPSGKDRDSTGQNILNGSAEPVSSSPPRKTPNPSAFSVFEPKPNVTIPHTASPNLPSPVPQLPTSFLTPPHSPPWPFISPLNNLTQALCNPLLTRFCSLPTIPPQLLASSQMLAESMKKNMETLNRQMLLTLLLGAQLRDCFSNSKPPANPNPLHNPHLVPSLPEVKCAELNEVKDEPATLASCFGVEDSDLPLKKRRFFPVPSYNPGIQGQQVVQQRRFPCMTLPSLHPTAQNVMASVSGPIHPTMMSCTSIAGPSKMPCDPSQAPQGNPFIPGPSSTKVETVDPLAMHCLPGSSQSMHPANPTIMAPVEPQGTWQQKHHIRVYPSGKKVGRPLGSFKRFDYSGRNKLTLSDVLRKESEESGASNEVVDVETLTEEKCEWDGCQLIFSTQKALVDHVAECHVNISNRDWICKWKNCDRTEPFRALYMLVVHVRKHTGEKPNECTHPGCNKSYSRLENLKTHMRTHTGEKWTFPKDCCRSSSGFVKKPYMCPIGQCGKCYTDPSSLRKHIKTVHGDEAYEMAKKSRPHNTGGRRRQPIQNGDSKDSGMETDAVSSADQDRVAENTNLNEVSRAALSPAGSSSSCQSSGTSSSSLGQQQSRSFFIDKILSDVSKATNFVEQKRLFQEAFNHPDFRWEMLFSYNLPNLNVLLKSVQEPPKDKLFDMYSSGSSDSGRHSGVLPGMLAKRAHLKPDPFQSKSDKGKDSGWPSTTVLPDGGSLSTCSFANTETCDDEDDEVIEDPGPLVASVDPLTRPGIAQGDVAVATRHSYHLSGRFPCVHEKYRMPMLDGGQFPDEETSVFLSDAALPANESYLDGFPDEMLASEERHPYPFVGIPLGSRSMASDCSSTLSSQAHFVQGSFTSIESQVLSEANNLEPDALNPDYGHYSETDVQGEYVPRVSPPLVPHFEQNFMPMEHLSEEHHSPISEMVHSTAPRTEYEFARRHMELEQQVEEEGMMINARLPPRERLLYRPGMDILNAGVLIQAHGHCEPTWYTEGDHFGIYNEAEIVQPLPDEENIQLEETNPEIDEVTTPPLSDDFDNVRDLPDFNLDNNSFIRDYLDEEALSFSMKNLNVMCPEHEPKPPKEK
ncbi:unnamed protein product [Nippostrongylus brasiliensis]|uniref:Sex-determining transformer protein 1 (inferred by orthology to a C. elegans protein) n=1 Tax=Nippostrongylus brasiliensis TaxID=27835 RepID=A0A158R070_NIPBR|nr:unnamed protein product [Nippostrongylus brasiliensis]